MALRQSWTAAVCLSLSAWSCAAPSLREAFHDSDAKRKALFLAVYSDLTPEQRKEFLAAPGDPVHILQEWKIGNPNIWSDPTSFAPGALVIETQAVTPVTTGRTLPIQAFLVQKDGKTRSEVTGEVTWSAQPNLAWVPAAGRVDYECLSQDVEIGADLLGERAARLTLPFRKKIKTLSIEVSESSQVVEKSDYLQLKVMAYCEDGTQSEVTCQSKWKLPKGLGRMSACGNLQIYDPEAFRTGEITVTADYASTQSTRRLHFRGIAR